MPLWRSITAVEGGQTEAIAMIRSDQWAGNASKGSVGRGPTAAHQAGTMQQHCPGTPPAPGSERPHHAGASQCLLGSVVSCTGLRSPGHARRDAERDQQHELVGGRSLPQEPGLLHLRARGHCSLGRDQDRQTSSKHLVDKFQVGEEQPGLRGDVGTWWCGS